MTPEDEVVRKQIASELGLSLSQVTDGLIAKIAEDPLFVYHLQTCKTDPEMLAILLYDTTSASEGIQQPVSAVKLTARAGFALARWAKSRFKRVDADEYNRRLSICKSCEHLSLPPLSSFLYSLMAVTGTTKSICGLCGCDVHKKAWMATEQCPDRTFANEGRW